MADPEELNEDSLFDEAVGDAPAEAVAEPAGEAAEPAGQARDEAGRFAGKPDDRPETVEATDPPAKERVDDNAPQVPSWRVREINEEKRALAAELETLRTERAQWQQRQQQTPKTEPAAEKAKPDPLLDPEGYAKAVRDEIREEIVAERREESLQRAREANPKEFDEAFAAARQAVDPALRARMQSSRDPGKTLLDWNRENKVKAEVGSDPNAWLEKKLEERLKDPAFLAKAVELARGSAQPSQANGRPRVDLPPSLNGASRSNAALRASQADMSDDALWEETTA